MMPAQGFKRIDAANLTPSMYGRIWRVNTIQREHSVSQGAKGVCSLTLTQDGVQVRRREGSKFIELADVDSVLIEEQQPAQKSIARWT